MDKPIVNRVSNSPLITINLEKIRFEGTRCFFDLKNILDKGVILRENKIRDYIKNHDWTQYSSQSKLLIAASLKSYARKIVIGDLEQLETVLFESAINQLDFTKYINKSIIIKGCSDPSIPDSAYGFLINKLQGVAKKISYGEACSSVPLWKSNK